MRVAEYGEGIGDAECGAEGQDCHGIGAADGSGKCSDGAATMFRDRSRLVIMRQAVSAVTQAHKGSILPEMLEAPKISSPGRRW